MGNDGGVHDNGNACLNASFQNASRGIPVCRGVFLLLTTSQFVFGCFAFRATPLRKPLEFAALAFLFRLFRCVPACGGALFFRANVLCAFVRSPLTAYYLRFTCVCLPCLSLFFTACFGAETKFFAVILFRPPCRKRALSVFFHKLSAFFHRKRKRRRTKPLQKVIYLTQLQQGAAHFRKVLCANTKKEKKRALLSCFYEKQKLHSSADVRRNSYGSGSKN